jgi:hypothetical protein
MKLFLKPTLLLLVLATLISGVGAVVLAQRGTSIVTRIKFARGRTSTIERGSVHRGMSHDYLLKAGAGQTMTVHLAARGGVVFDVLSPGERYTIVHDTKDWSDQLNESGDYRINVLPDTATERSIPYTLEVTVR